MDSEAAAKAPQALATGAGKRSGGAQMSSTMPVTTIASRQASPKNPNVNSGMRAVTRARWIVDCARAAAQPSAKHHRTIVPV